MGRGGGQRPLNGGPYSGLFLAGVGTGLASRGAGRNEMAAPPKTAEAQDVLYRVYRELYPALKDDMHTLADLQAASPGKVAATPA